MTTQAISAFGIQLRLGDGVSPGGVAISAATNATPIVLTTTAHGITDVSLVTVAGVAGNTAANGTWIAERVTNTTLKLRGSIGNGVYTSGGTATVTDTFTVIAEVTDIQDAGISATVVDVTAHDGASSFGSMLPTFLHGNALRLSLHLVPAHATHDNATGLEFLLRTRTQRNYLLVLPDTAKTTWKWKGFVTSHRSAAPVAGVLATVATIEMTDAPILAAA